MNFGLIARWVTVRVLVIALLFAFINPLQKAGAVGNFTNSKDTLSSSRPSISTTLGGAVTAGDTTVTLASTTNILQTDVLTLAQGTPETVTVASVTDGTHIALTAAASNAHTNASAVYDKQTSKHTITFTTRSAVANGSFLVTFPVAGSNQNDGIPDSTGFDFNSLATSDVTLSGGTAGTIVVTPASGTVSVPFTGTIAASTAITITIGNTNKLLNPTKTAASGTADTWTVKTDEKDANGVIDTSSVSVGTIESVSISVSISPTLNFSIASVASGQTAFSATNTDVTSTTTTVPFGTIPTATPKYAAHDLTVSTNAVGGYTVTSFESGPLSISGSGTTIPDFSTTAADNNSNDGFGYSGRNLAGTDCSVVFNASGTFYSSGFGTSTTPTSVMTNSGPVSGSQCRIIYRVKVPATQAPGDYRTTVSYIATGKY